MKKIVAQFIPILLLFFLLTAVRPFIQFSNTIWGKLLAVCIIVFYTALDKILGLFICSLVILFYQWNDVEGMETQSFLLQEAEIIEPETNLVNIIDDEVYIPQDETVSETETGANTKYPKGISAYRWMDYVEEDPVNPHIAVQEVFRKENCKNGVLLYKNNAVRKDMADFVFPELKMNTTVCNPCDKTCSFSIVENKLKTEKELMPKELMPKE
jgi:hypothetical protein